MIVRFHVPRVQTDLTEFVLRLFLQQKLETSFSPLTGDKVEMNIGYVTFLVAHETALSGDVVWKQRRQCGDEVESKSCLTIVRETSSPWERYGLDESFQNFSAMP